MRRRTAPRSKLAGRTMVVTGGTSGIGRALVHAGCSAGMRVLTCGRDRERLAGLRISAPDVVAVDADLALEADIDRLLAEIRAWSSSVDVLVNNAGASGGDSFSATSFDAATVRQSIAVNLTAPIVLTGELLPLVEASTLRTIVNMTSVVGLVPIGRSPVYGATKAGLRLFTRALDQQLHERGIRVLEALPPLTDTPMAAAVPKAKVAPDFWAEAVLDAVALGRHCSMGANDVRRRASSSLELLLGRGLR